MRNDYNIFFILLIILGVFLIFPFNNDDAKLNIVGSSSVQPICEGLVEEYKKTHKNVDINVQGGGSSLGIKCANNSLADIGMSSKEVNDSTNLSAHIIGIEGIAIVVNPNNPVNGLSSVQIKNIFSGNISHWDEISNGSGKINVIVREEGSGTLNAFKEEIMGDSQITDDAIIQNSAGAIKQAVSKDENAIGFVSLVHLDDSLKDIRIDGVKISEKSLIDGSYKLQRPFLLLTNNTPDNETLNFLNWVKSSESSEIFKEEKIIKID